MVNGLPQVLDLNIFFSLSCNGFSPIYDEVILLCLDLGEVDAAIAIVTDMETTGIKVPDQTLDKVLSARQGIAELASEEEVDSNSLSDWSQGGGSNKNISSGDLSNTSNIDG